MHQSTRVGMHWAHIVVILSLCVTLLPDIAHAQPATPPRILDPRLVPAVTQSNITPPQACTPMPECEEAPFYVIYGQNQTPTSRTVVLNWTNYPGRIGTYQIYRSVSPSSETLIATTGILATETDFINTLNTTPNLLNTLQMAMSSTMTALTTTQLYATFNTLNTATVTDTLKARIAIQKYPALAQAVGLGYSDTMTTNLTTTIQYTIKHVKDSGVVTVGSVTVSPDSAGTTIPTPSNLREAGVYDGPTDVGIINSVRSKTAAERYDSSLMQNEVSNDGKVYLMWDKGFNITPNRIVTGYNVYRQAVGGILWNKLNTNIVSMASSQPYSPSQFEIGPNQYPSYFDEPYFVVDSQITASSDYKAWKYKVCPVDLAGKEGTCSNILTAVKRDLIPPSQVTDIQAKTVYPTGSASPGKFELKWKYMDRDGINNGALPVFYVTRAVTTGLQLSNWTTIGSGINATSLITATYVLTDTPPLNTIYWYRIQVRDNAGNWSAISAPIKGAVFDRVAPDKPKLTALQKGKPCYDKLPTRLGVPSDVRQVVLSRRLSTSGDWRIIRRFRPNTNGSKPYGVDIVDKYLVPQPNAPVYYKIEYVDAYGNISIPTGACVRGNSPNDLLPPRFILSIRNNDNGDRNVTLDFGSTTDIYSRSVVIARATTTKSTDVLTTTVAGDKSTFSFKIDTGESLRVGAISTALTATTELSSTLNSRWVRNVNNFLNLNIIPDDVHFLDTPRNMAQLGSLTMAWSSGNNEACRDSIVPARKACATISATGYGKTEKPPAVALFRRLSPASVGTQAALSVPWIQVTPITEWTLKNGKYVVEDTSIMDVTRNYEYMAVAHSSTSYEVIGYFGATTLLGTVPAKPVTSIAVGVPANTTTMSTSLPAGCTFSGAIPTAERVAVDEANIALLPPKFFDDSDNIVNTFDLGNNWTFRADFVIRPRLKICGITNPATTDKNLYLIGTLLAGTREISSGVRVYKAAISAPGRFVATKFRSTFPPALDLTTITSAVPNGLTIKIRDLVYQVDAGGVMTTTTALTVTLPTHMSLAIDTTDPVYSYKRAKTLVFYTNNFDGTYDVDGLANELDSNWSFWTTPTATQPAAVIVDEYSPWFYRISGRIHIAQDVSGLTFDTIIARSRFIYTPPSYANFIPDNNAGFVGNTGVSGRDYYYDGPDIAINTKGIFGTLTNTLPVSYVTSYPAGMQITAGGGASFVLDQSIITSGTLTNPQVKLKHIYRDTDTSYTKLVSGRPTLVRANYLPIDKRFSFTPTFNTQIITINTDPTITMGAAGILTATVSTNDTIKWPGFSMTPISSSIDMTLYLAPATPVGMSATYATIPKPAESAWEQIDLGYSDDSDLDPGLNFNGKNTVSYGCYGSGEFMANMDAYLRYGGFSEHVILEGLGDSVKNNTTGYDETLTKFSAIFADNVIVDPTDVQSNLYLPYPSDVTLPLQSTTFNGNGCPVGGEMVDGPQNVTHKYWNFAENATGYGYVSGTALTKYAILYIKSRGGVVNATTIADAKTHLPNVILQVTGNLRPLAARDKNNQQSNISGVSEWLPNGEFGNITLGVPTEFYSSGMPFTPNDIILNRFNSVFLDNTSPPSTAGFADKAGGLPSKLLDPDTGELTEASLAACVASTSEPLGCGLQIIDGNSAMSYFGEPSKCTSGCGGISSVRVTPRASSGDTPSGDGSIGSAGDGSEEGDTLWNPVMAQWIWDQGTTALNFDLPLVFIANKSGGVFTGLLRKQKILPDPAELFKTDISLVVNGRLLSGTFITDIGIFFGYSASQASLRALATHRPTSDNTGFKSFTNFSDVKDDVTKWADTLGYGTYDDNNDKDDPVDMLQDMWTGYSADGATHKWGDPFNSQTFTSGNDYKSVFYFLEPKLKGAGTSELYTGTNGIMPLQQGKVLQDACTYLKNGHGAAQFQLVGTDIKLEQIAFGTYLDIKNAGAGSCNADSLLSIQRVSLNITGDGEITILADHIKTIILEKEVDFDVQLIIGTGAGNHRLEGGIKLYTLTVASVEFTEIGVVFGVGQYNNFLIAYFGFNGSGKFKGYGVSASFLFGILSPSSAVLKAQFGSLMDKLAADKGSTTAIYKGVYISVGVQVPIYKDGCMREVIANGEMRGWYFEQIAPVTSAVAWGGYLSAGVSGEAACLVSARGQLSLSIYSSSNVLHFDGDAWLAGGVGDCEPTTWNNWDNRWWGDSWCAQAGAYVLVTYVEGGGWDVAYNLDAESPW